MNAKVTQDPLSYYRQLIKTDEFDADPAQEAIVQALQQRHNQLTHKPGWLAKLRGRSSSVKGLYIHGDVGRGKTWLMDIFYDALPIERKQRLHFHRFMLRIHAQLKAMKHTENPLQRIAEQWAARTRVLCLDEFFVNDITDAMLLSGLLESLFEHGVCLVTTSNVPPADLYSGGLQRERFLPAIALLEQHTDVVCLDADQDYRLRILESAPMLHVPHNESATKALQQTFHRLCPGSHKSDAHLVLNHRAIAFIKRGDGVIWCSFDVLCDGPRANADYIELARAFNTVLISNVPILDDSKNDPARRFIHMIDEFYDRRVKVALSAETNIDALYQGERLKFEYDRTRSRLTEMQTHAYLAEPHRPE